MSYKDRDRQAILLVRRISIPFARFALFVVFFWFGILKVVGLSPASGLVQNLFEQTITFMSFNQFLILFGLFECLIGILFLLPGFERLAIGLLFLHMFMTFMPLIMLPTEIWNGVWVPTLEGQYIIKNLVIIASALFIFSGLTPLSEVKSER